jgi:hypothetical protein
VSSELSKIQHKYSGNQNISHTLNGNRPTIKNYEVQRLSNLVISMKVSRMYYLRVDKLIFILIVKQRHSCNISGSVNIVCNGKIGEL